MSWFDKLSDRFKPKERSSVLGDVAPPATPPEAWTVPGIRFDTRGWMLSGSSPLRMSWTGPDATLTLSRHEGPGDQPPLSLTDLRDQHRTMARANEEDIVTVEIVEMAVGQALQTICKRREGRGTIYKGSLDLHCVSERFRIASEIGEGGTTGMREAIVSAMLVQCGEFALGEQKADGGFAIRGWSYDPYDEAFDAAALNGIADDERVDAVMPDHPLTRTRALLELIASSLTLDRGAVASANVVQDDGDPPPMRRQLSSRVARAVWANAQRDDLIELSFKEDFAALADNPSQKLAECLLEMGIFFEMKDRTAEALPLLRRAAAMFETVAGPDVLQTAVAKAHQGYTLFKLGEHAPALRLLSAAVKFFEMKPEDDMTYALALNGVSQILFEQGDRELAKEYLNRLRELMETSPRLKRTR